MIEIVDRKHAGETEDPPIERRVLRWIVAGACAAAGVVSINTTLPTWPCILALCAVWEPKRCWLAALGVSYLAGAVLIATSWNLRGPIASASMTIGLWCSVGLGAFYAYLALTRRKADALYAGRLDLRLLASIVALIAVGQVVAYRSAVLSSEAARLRPAAGAVAFGAAVLWFYRRRATSILLGCLIAGLGVAPRVMASEWYRQTIVRDPLIVRAGTVTWSAAPERIGDLKLHDAVREIDIAPSGEKYVYQAREDFSYVSTVAGTVKGIHSGQVRFVDDDRVLALVSVPEGTELRELRPFDDAKAPSWHYLLPRGLNMKLIVDGRTMGWHVGFRATDGGLHWISGTVGVDGSHEILVEETDASRETVTFDVDGEMVVGVTTHRHREHPEDAGWDERLPSRSSGPTAILSATGEAVVDQSRQTFSTMFSVQCEPLFVGRPRVLCLAGDDWESNMWLVDRQSQRVEVEPLLRAGGARVLLAARDSAVVLAGPQDLIWVDTETRRAARLPYPNGRRSNPFDGRAIVGLGSGIVGVVDRANSTLMLYRIQ